MRKIVTDAAAIGNAAGRTHSKLYSRLVTPFFDVTSSWPIGTGCRLRPYV
jgi:hypothetical protein